MYASPQEIYAYLRSMGVSEASAAGILVNIQFESSFEYTNDTGDNGTSAGLFQHHLGRWDNLKAYAISRGTTWNADWRIQVDFALIEARQMGINLQSNDAQAATKEWTIRFERPQDSKIKAEQRAQSVSQYMYGDPGNMNVTSGNAAPQVGNETLNLPEGGSWFKVGGGYFVAFRFYGNDNKEGPSAVVYYLATFPPPEGTKIHSETAWNTYSSGWVDGGTTDTFRGVPAGKSYQDLVNDLLLQLGLAGTDALQVAGIMAIKEKLERRKFRGMNPSDAEIGIGFIRPGHTKSADVINTSWSIALTAVGTWDRWLDSAATSGYALPEDFGLIITHFVSEVTPTPFVRTAHFIIGRQDLIPEDVSDIVLGDNENGVAVFPIPTKIVLPEDELRVRLEG
ncbi:hypothetical protein LCGC14_2376610, partial [marine sediment metagenome]